VDAYTTGLVSHGEACIGRTKPEQKAFAPVKAILPQPVGYATTMLNGTWYFGVDGTPYYTGGDLYGEAALGGRSGEYVWEPSSGLLGALKPRIVSTSGGHGCLVGADGLLRTWGTTKYGVSGDGVYTPVKEVEGGPNVVMNATPVLTGKAKTGKLLARPVAVASGSHTVYVLLENRGVMTWGDNGSGQSGKGTHGTTPILYPTRIPNLGNVVAIAAGGVHAVALQADGTVLAWGDNSAGQLGVDNGGKDLYVPTKVEGLPPIVFIAAGGKQTLAVDFAGNLFQFGERTKDDVGPNPVPTLWATDCTAAACGSQPHGHAICGRELVGWGNDVYGELGDAQNLVEGRQSDKPVPVGSGLTGLPGSWCAADEFHAVAVA
jgi:hypothetical protein